jgi:hypothetical protein
MSAPKKQKIEAKINAESVQLTESNDDSAAWNAKLGAQVRLLVEEAGCRPVVLWTPKGIPEGLEDYPEFAASPMGVCFRNDKDPVFAVPLGSGEVNRILNFMAYHHKRGPTSCLLPVL